MGGFGSGRSYHKGRPSRGGKALTSHCYSLDISESIKKYNKAPGVCVYGKFGFVFDDDAILVKRLDGEKLLTEEIAVTTMPCHFGGLRYFGLCPLCQRQVRILYLRKSLLACRHCHNLSYHSKNVSFSTRLLLKFLEIKKKINGDEYTKPKWMRWKTFEKLKEQYFELDEKSQIADIYALRNNKSVDILFDQYGCAFAAADALEM